MPITKRRLLNTGAAFLLSFGTASVVWFNGHKAGITEHPIAVHPTATATPAASIFSAPSGSADALSDRLRALEQASRQAPTRDAKLQIAMDLYELGRTAHFQNKGQGALSIQAYSKALLLLRQLQRPDEVAAVLTDLADAQALLGEPHQAQTSLRAALALREAGVGKTSQKADVLSRLGNLLRKQGDYANARKALDRALRLQQRLAFEPGQAECLTALGQLAYEEEQLALARQLLQEAIRLFGKNGMVESRAAALGQLGDVALKEGETSEAERLFAEGLAVWEATKQDFWIGCFLIRQANLALRSDDLARARELAQRAQKLLSASNGSPAQAGAFLVLAEVDLRQGERVSSEQNLTRAEGYYRTSGSAYGISECKRVRDHSLSLTVHRSAMP